MGGERFGYPAAGGWAARATVAAMRMTHDASCEWEEVRGRCLKYYL